MFNHNHNKICTQNEEEMQCFITLYHYLNSTLNSVKIQIFYAFRKVLVISGLWFLRNFPDFRIFTSLPLPQNVLESREVATKERKPVLCPTLILLVGMWRVWKLSAIKNPVGSGGFVLQTKGRPRPATHFSGFLFTFVKSHPCLYRSSIITLYKLHVLLNSEDSNFFKILVFNDHNKTRDESYKVSD